MESTFKQILNDLFTNYVDNNPENKDYVIAYELYKKYVLYDIDTYMKDNKIEIYEELDATQMSIVKQIGYFIYKNKEIEDTILYFLINNLDYDEDSTPELPYPTSRIYTDLINHSSLDIVRLSDKQKIFARYSLLMIWDNIETLESEPLPHYLKLILEREPETEIEETYLYRVMSNKLRYIDRDLSDKYDEMSGI